MSTKRRTLGVFASPPPRDAEGKKLCRNCHGPMKQGRNYHNCSSKCSEEWAIKTTPALMRRAVFLRDRGICAICKAVTEAQRKEYCETVKKNGTAFCAAADKLRTKFNITAGRAASGDWWEADHILPVTEGGGECGLENIRTLCISCHKSETAKLYKRLADQRHALKADERDRAGLFAEILDAAIQFPAVPVPAASKRTGRREKRK